MDEKCSDAVCDADKDPVVKPRDDTNSGNIIGVKPIANHRLFLAFLMLAGSLSAAPVDSLYSPPPRALSGSQAEQDPALSPDGRYLVYSREERGNRDLWMRRVDSGVLGELPQRLTEHAAPDLRPRWSPDGRWIYFLSMRDDAAGDIWRLRLHRRWGSLKAGKAEAVLVRPGAQDNPCPHADGSLYFDETGPEGPRLMAFAADSLRRIAEPARLPVAWGDSLLYLAPREDGLSGLYWWHKGAKGELWSPPGGVLEMAALGSERIWLCGLPFAEQNPAGPTLVQQALRRATEYRGEAGLWLLDFRQSPPLVLNLLPPGRDPRQLSLAQTADAGPQLVLTEGRGRSSLRLQAASGSLRDSLEVQEFQLLLAAEGESPRREWLLERMASQFPATVEGEEAALAALRLAMRRPLLRGEDLLHRCRQLMRELSQGDLRTRASLLLQVLRLREEADPLAGQELASALDAECLALARAGQTGPAAEGWLELGRWRLSRGERAAALRVLQQVSELCPGEPEEATALLLRHWAYREQGSAEAARGSLRELAQGFPQQADLLSSWQESLRAQLDALPASVALAHVRDELAALGGVPGVGEALQLELARAEARLPEAMDLALSDLEGLRRQSLEGQSAFSRQVLLQAREARARWLMRSGRGDEALRELAGELQLLGEAGRPLETLRLSLLMERAGRAARSGDAALALADYQRVLALDGENVEALRGLAEAAAAEGRILEIAGPWLARAESDSVRAIDYYAAGLFHSWRAAEDPAALPESDHWLALALGAAPDMIRAYQTLAWNLAEERRQILQRKTGLKGLIDEVGQGNRIVRRWLRDVRQMDPEELLDRGLALLERALELAAEEEPGLRPELLRNLGNLHFTRGEFGAPAAREAWDRALAEGLDFRNEADLLGFRHKQGLVLQWLGEEQAAREALQEAESLAGQLGRGSEQRELLARLGLLESQAGRFATARSHYQRAFSLEPDPGQQGILARNLAWCSLELGDTEQARRDLRQSEELLAQADWPLPVPSNWLRIQLFGLRVPLWNFPGLGTGEGKLTWKPRDEELLRASLQARIEEREGRGDRALASLHERRKSLRRAGDSVGRVQLDLAIGAWLARSGQLEEAAERFQVAREEAADELLGMGLEGQAAVAELSLRLLSKNPEMDVRKWDRYLNLIQKFRSRMAEGESLPRRTAVQLQCLRAEVLLELGELSLRDGLVGPVSLDYRAQAMAVLDSLAAGQLAPALPAPSELGQIDLGRARVHRLLGESKSADRLVEALQAGPAPAVEEQLALLDPAGLDSLRARLAREPELFHQQDPARIARIRGALRNGLDLAEQQGDRERYRQLMHWWRWWEGRRPWGDRSLRLPRESDTNAWQNLLADLEELRQVREDSRRAEADLARRRAAGELPDSSVAIALRAERERLEGWVIQDRELLRKGESTRTLIEPGNRRRSISPGEPLDPLSMLYFNSDAFCPVALFDPAEVPPAAHRICLLYGDAGVGKELEANRVTGGDWISWIGEGHPDPRLRVLGPEAMGSADPRLDGRVLVLEATLELVCGDPASSWFDFGEGRRLDLRDLLQRRWSSETLGIAGLRRTGALSEEGPAWIFLESVLAKAGFRRWWLPAENVRLSGERFLAASLKELKGGVDRPGDYVGLERPPDPDLQFTELQIFGLPRTTPEERLEQGRAGLEEVLGLAVAQYREKRYGRAWEHFRRAIDLAQRLGETATVVRLRPLAAKSAGRGDGASERSRHALSALLERTAPLPGLEHGEAAWPQADAPYLEELLLLADRAGRREVARACLAALEEANPQGMKALGDRRVSRLSQAGAVLPAAALAEELELMPQGEDPRRALFLAKTYLDGGSPDLALTAFRAPVVAWQELQPPALLDKLELEAVAAMRLGQLSLARRGLEQAGELAAGMRPDSARQALSGLRRADLAWQEGLASGAFRELDAVRSLLPANRPELRLLWENTSGLVRQSLGEGPAALAHFRRALAEAQGLGDAREESAVRNNLARSLLAEGHSDMALQELQLARAAEQRAGLSGVVTRRNLAEAWLSLPGREALRRAREHLDEARLRAAKEALRLEELRLSLLASRLERLSGNPEAARGHAESALALARKLEWREGLWKSHLQLGLALEEAQQPLAAREQLDRAAAALEELRQAQAGSRFRSGVQSAQAELVESRLRLALQAREPEEALVLADRSHAVGFEDLLAWRERGKEQDAALRSRSDSLQLEFSLARQALERGRGGSRNEEQRLARLRAELEASRLALQAAEQGRMPEQPARTAPLLPRLRAALGPRQAIVFYQLGPREGQLFWLRGDSLGHRRLELAPDSLARLAERHRTRTLQLLSTEGSARQLAQVLIDPLLEQLEGVDELILVPHGALHRLPFASLELEQGLLIDRFALSQQPSLAFWLRSREQQAVEGPGRAWCNPPGAELDFAVLECQAARASWPGLRILQDDAASRKAVLEDSVARAIRHFSCHGLHDPQSPAASGLLLGEGEEVRLLDATTISALELPTELVALSACDTGLGRTVSGDEVAGLPRAFALAGARSVFSSLWKVDDLSTAVLVKHFYRNLAAGQSRAEALRQAQRTVRDELNPHPVYWAAFTLCGVTDSMP